MRTFYFSLLLFFVTPVFSCNLDISLTSIHSQRGFNEHNEGLGVECDIHSYSISAGTLINSMSERSYYIGNVIRTNKKHGVNAGLFMGAVYYPPDIGYTFAILPFMEVGKDFVLRATYIPKLDPESDSAILFQISVPFKQ